MYKQNKIRHTSIKVNDSVEGERLETKIERIIGNKEPVTDGAPIMYTERKDGVQPAYNIRTDRFEVALDGMDKVTQSKIAKREENMSKRETKIVDINDGKSSGAESTQGSSE